MNGDVHFLLLLNKMNSRVPYTYAGVALMEFKIQFLSARR